jgi:hypothetical protein
MKGPFVALTILLAVAVGGCVDVEQDYALNPDGSGKVHVTAVGTLIRFDVGQRKDSQEALNEAVREVIDSSEGVDAWTGVECILRDDGKLSFTGTAYFKNLGQLRLNVLGLKSQDRELDLRQHGQDGLVVELDHGEDASMERREVTRTKLTDEQVRAKIREARADYQQAKPFLEGFLSEFRMKTRLNLPGVVTDAGIFERAGPSTVEIAFDGEAMLKTMDELITDEAHMKRQVEAGKDTEVGESVDDDLFVQRMLGRKGLPRVVVNGPLKPVFDYEAEAAPARAGMDALRAKFAAREASAEAPRKAGALKQVNVMGVHSAGEDLRITIVADLPIRVLAVKQAELSHAITDSGEDLLPEEKFWRMIHFPRLSESKDTVALDVSVKAPSADARRLKLVAGRMIYTTGHEVGAHKLSLSALRTGTEDSALGAEIAVSENPFGDGNLSLRLDVEPEQVESITLLDGQGKEIAMDRTGWHGSGGSTVFSLFITGQLPAEGEIVVKTFADFTSYEVEFQVGEVDLLRGR